jgi:hypothetical protein
MKRRNFLTTISTAAVLLPQLSDAAPGNKQTGINAKNGTIMHSVYFWLKKDISKEEEQDFLQYFELLKSTPGVASLSFGKPAKTKRRDVTDNSFDYNLVILFNNLQQISIYENHPDHLAGAKKYQKYWEKVQVRDTEWITG